ncbi:FAD-dependent monooxygenase [Actinomadura sp. 21ATH]|uniref:FAD-dependent monooxygenase n=1 Tax=Actinomadura sp. 21ATH TaxID=1735444 RepID=UPI0035C12533
MVTSSVSAQVGVIGAGPAGLVTAAVLAQAGIDVCVVEQRRREHVERRPRAGLLEHRVVEYLHACGLADRLLAEAIRHGRCEFACQGERVNVEYGALSGGFGHWVYPQQFLVRDLIATLERLGAGPRFQRRATAVLDPAGPRPVIECEGLRVACDFVVACDGPYGVAARPPGARAARQAAYRYPYDWLTVLAEVARPVEAVVYAIHPGGFAGMMPRAGHQARLYLQIPAGQPPRVWTGARIREQLAVRMGEAAPGLPAVGTVRETGVLRMRGSVARTVRYGRTLLAGDAAHLLTPSGAKGMNLAVSDAADAAASLISWYRDGDPAGVDGYGARRLAEAWSVQDFSDRLLHLLHLPEGGRDERFLLDLKLRRVQDLARPTPGAVAFAHQYGGSGRHPDAAPPLPLPSGLAPARPLPRPRPAGLARTGRA